MVAALEVGEVEPHLAYVRGVVHEVLVQLSDPVRLVERREVALPSVKPGGV